MKLEDLKKLVENVKLEESITFLKGHAIGPRVIFEDRLILLAGRLTTHRQEMADSTTPKERITDIQKSILSLAYEMHKSGGGQNEIELLLESSLVMKNSFPFIDRSEFREKLDNMLTTNEAHIFLVEGAPKSGMSHLEKFLRHLSENIKIFTLIPCDIPKILEGPEMILGERLAKYISYALGMEVNFDEQENEQFKFIQFLNALKDKIRSEGRIPLFFLHDFHRIEDDNENLLELIYMLLTSINADFPKSLFIIAGLNYAKLRNWHTDLKYTTTIYNMEEVQIDDIKKCLKCVFGEFSDKIKEKLKQQISEEEYVESMLEELMGPGQEVNIEKVGLALADHLYALKK
ncbi:MAG: hypothetical protein AB3N14_09520 [Flavobacteriaceae bacterium]